MVTRRALLVLLTVLGTLLAGPARAAEARLQLAIDQLQEGQRVSFEVVLEGAKPRSVPDVRVEDGLAVSYVGQQQSTSIVNGRMSQWISFQYELVARRQGKWTLGPAYVKVDEGNGRGRDLTAAPITVVVGPKAAAGAVPGWIEAVTELDRKEAWQGEAVVYHAVVRTRRQLAAAGWYGAPEQGLMAPKDARPEQREYVVQDSRGDMLVDETWTPFVVTGAGSLSWPAPALQVEILEDTRGLFFRQTKSEVIPAQPLSLEVRPLPPPPPGFSGLVGDFTMAARVERSRARVGESIDWTVVIEGHGALDGFDLPKPGALDGLQVYPQEARGRAQVRQGRFEAGVAFQRTVVPSREGTFTLPPVQVVTFSPTAGDYVTLTTEPVTLTVVPGEGVDVQVRSFAGDEPADAGPDPDLDQVRPLRTTGPGLRLPWDAWSPVVMGAAAAPALAMWGAAAAQGGLALWARRRRREARVATPLERLDQLPHEPEARLVAIDQALRLALADATGVPVGDLDRTAAIDALPPDLADEARRVAQQLDRARFAGAAVPADLEPRVRAVVAALGRAA